LERELGTVVHDFYEVSWLIIEIRCIVDMIPFLDLKRTMPHMKLLFKIK
jgi:hypothetical protein